MTKMCSRVAGCVLALMLPVAVHAQMPAPRPVSFGTPVVTGAVLGTYTMPGAVELQVPPVINPNGIEFTPSPDHSRVSATVNMVARYVMLIATAAAPTVYLKTVDLGKPTPVAGKITCDASSACNGLDFTAVRESLAAGSYVGFVRTEGPGGSALSVASDPFTVQALPPAAAGKVGWK